MTTIRTALVIGVVLALSACDAGPDGDPSSVDVGGPDDDRALIGEAVRAMGEARYEQVGPLLEPYLALDPPDVDAQFIAGSAASELKRWGEAVERLTDAAARKQEFVANVSALGFAHVKLGQFDQAREVFAAIVEAEPTREKAHYGLGLVALELGELDRAGPHLDESLRLAPTYTKALFAHARLLEQQQRLEEARNELIEVVGRQPDHVEALFLLARVLDDLGDHEEASEVLARRERVYSFLETIGSQQDAIFGGDDDPARWISIVSLRLEMGDRRGATEALQQGLIRHPNAAGLIALARSLGGH